MRIAGIFAAVLALPAWAQDWNLRGSDEALSAEEIGTSVVGRTLTFYDDGQSKFSAGGSYSYTYGGGGTAFGTFEVGADGVICISYANGWSRCDKYVRSGDRLVVLTEDGERYPVRN